MTTHSIETTTDAIRVEAQYYVRLLRTNTNAFHAETIDYKTFSDAQKATWQQIVRDVDVNEEVLRILREREVV